MPVEISVITRRFVTRIQRTELRSLNGSVASFLHNWSDPLGVPSDREDLECPYVVTSRATVEAAQALVLRQSVGIRNQLTVEEFENVLAEVLLGDREGHYLNLLRFLETGCVAVPEEAFSNMPHIGEVVVSLPALEMDLRSVVTSNLKMTNHIALSNGLANGFLQWLLGAAKWCIDERKLLYCIVRVDKWDGSTRIRDRRIGEQGFNRFKRVSVDDKGRLLVRYFSGATYRIPCEYLRALLGANEDNPLIPCQLQRARIQRGREQAEIVFSDGRVSNLGWDEVLMACEPLYEHFGGLTDAGRKLIEKWNRDHPPFRISPQVGARSAIE